jgi:hypothetical protein
MNIRQRNLKVNASESFLHRAICKKCKGHPTYYAYHRNPILWYDPRRINSSFEYVKKYKQRLSPEEFSFVLDDFRFANELNLYNHPVNYKSYRPKLHRVRGQNPISNITEFLTCKCRQTVWAYSDVNHAYKNEIKHRKSRIYITKKFMY